MKSFKQFLITEKISSSEIKRGLSDPKIRVGLEFEFILSDISPQEFEFNGYSLDDLDTILERYVSKCRHWIINVKNTIENYFLIMKLIFLNLSTEIKHHLKLNIL